LNIEAVSEIPRGAPLLDLQLSGIVSPRMKHVIKRYLKRIGYLDVEVVHLVDGGGMGVRLVASGRLPAGAQGDLTDRLQHLESSVLEVLSQKVGGSVPHPSRVDPELLRLKLSEIEPSLKRVFYKVA
jgi:hypothetical protein